MQMLVQWWPVLGLGVVFYAAVTAVLYTLAARIEGTLARHSLIAETRRRRIAYLEAAAAKRDQTKPVEPEAEGCDVLDDEAGEAGVEYEAVAGPAGTIAEADVLKQAA